MLALLSTLQATYLSLNYKPVLHWFGQFAFRIALAFLVVLALYNIKDGINLLINSLTLLNIIVISIVTLATVISFNFELFRHVNQIIRLPQFSFLKYTIFGDPNTLSAVITLSFPLVFLRFSQHKNQKILLILTLFNLLSIISCRSRMQIFVFGFEVFILFFVLRLSFYGKIAMSVVVIVMLTGLFFVSAPRLKQKLEMYSITKSSVRIAMMRSAFAAIRERPFLGHGPGMAKESINRYDFINEYYSTLHGRPVEVHLGIHNTILTIAVDVGVPGALGFLAAVLGLIWCALKRLKFLCRDDEKLFLIAWILFGTLFYGVCATDLGGGDGEVMGESLPSV
jgi:hypothetical protein